MHIAEQFLFPFEVEDRPRPFESSYPEEGEILNRFYKSGGVAKWEVCEDFTIDVSTKLDKVAPCKF